MTRGEIAQRIHERLQGARFAGVTLEVMENDIRRFDDWWRVPVRPNAWPTRMFEYYEALAELESDLQENDGINVLFATAEPAGVPAS